MPTLPIILWDSQIKRLCLWPRPSPLDASRWSSVLHPWRWKLLIRGKNITPEEDSTCPPSVWLHQTKQIQVQWASGAELNTVLTTAPVGSWFSWCQSTPGFITSAPRRQCTAETMTYIYGGVIAVLAPCDVFHTALNLTKHCAQDISVRPTIWKEKCQLARGGGVEGRLAREWLPLSLRSPFTALYSKTKENSNNFSLLHQRTLLQQSNLVPL